MEGIPNNDETSPIPGDVRREGGGKKSEDSFLSCPDVRDSSTALIMFTMRSLSSSP